MLSAVALLAAVSVPIGIFLSVLLWRDSVLPLLSVVTVFAAAYFIAHFFTKMPLGFLERFLHEIMFLSGILIFALEASWFLRRRRRRAEVDGNGA